MTFPDRSLRLVALLICTTAAVDANAQTLEQRFLPSGVTARQGGYRPIRSIMDKTSEIVQVAPEGLEAPRYGTIDIEDQSWAYIIDERSEGDSVFYLDSNADGDLTNDPPAKWKSSLVGDFKQYSGGAEIDLGNDNQGRIQFYRFDPNDESRAALKDALLFYTDYGYEFEFELDGNKFSTFISGQPTEKSGLPIDRDGNGKISRRFEYTSIGTPFNFTGTPHVFEMKDGMLSLEKSAAPLEQMPLPPNLEIGKQALEFAATTMDGAELNFPGDYAGKIVMLDFWATWCGPCIGEIPHMKEAYANWNEQGFDILGISFDRAEMEEKIREFLTKNEQPWTQIYEGKMWDTELGAMHDVGGIPFVLLVDGDSGEILATARQLRGPGLSDFVKSALEKKFDIQLESKPKQAPEEGDGEKDKDAGNSEEAAQPTP